MCLTLYWTIPALWQTGTRECSKEHIGSCAGHTQVYTQRSVCLKLVRAASATTCMTSDDELQTKKVVLKMLRSLQESNAAIYTSKNIS